MGIPSPAALRRALANYPAVVDRQPVARLAALDRWYHGELHDVIAGRAPAYIKRDELVRVTEWKMARGVWRQANLMRVRSNTAAAVERTSRRALAHVPDPKLPIAELATLEGVGPATASAVVAIVAPHLYPFFDEIVAAQLPGLGDVKWTLGYYARYADALRSLAGNLGGDWTPAALEQALWAHAGGGNGARSSAAR